MREDIQAIRGSSASTANSTAIAASKNFTVVYDAEKATKADSRFRAGLA